MPGVSAATQSSRCGKSPKEPARVSATIRDTPVFSPKTWKGRSTLRFICVSAMSDLRSSFHRRLWQRPWRLLRLGLRNGLRVRLDGGLGLGSGSCRGRIGFRFALRLGDRPDHVEGALRVVLEFIAQDSLAAVQRVREADELSFEAGELLGREEGLGEKAFQPTGAGDHLAIRWRELLEAQHG